MTYSYQNPYPNDGALRRKFELNNKISAEFAVASDMNPGVKGDNDNVLAVTSTSSAQQMKQGNSNNHDQDGQNVLYGDGHVEFQQNPFVGVQREIRAPAGRRQFRVAQQCGEQRSRDQERTREQSRACHSSLKTAIRSIQNTGIEVTGIKDVTPVPHNGCRPPKRRRV